MTGKIKLVSF